MPVVESKVLPTKAPAAHDHFQRQGQHQQYACSHGRDGQDSGQCGVAGTSQRDADAAQIGCEISPGLGGRISGMHQGLLGGT